MDRLFVQTLGEKGPVLVLLHGMGGHGDLWLPFIEKTNALGNFRFIIPDLRGHGRSPRGKDYGYGQHAADVAEIIPAGEPYFVVGHSMGGAIGVAMASRLFGPVPDGVFAFATKTRFTEAELDKLRIYAASTPKMFTEESQVIERFLKTGGLAGIVDPTTSMARVGVAKSGEGFSLASDPRTVLAATGPSISQLQQLAVVPVMYARGERDDMVSSANLNELSDSHKVITGSGHNSHVDSPAALAQMVAAWLGEMPQPHV